MAKFVREVNAPKLVQSYYDKLVPAVYGYRFLAPIKWLAFNIIGIFKPIVRRPVSGRDIEEVSIKSAALASENFMLAITAQGFASCPMEGIDESRIKKMLKLARGSRVVMVISVGEGDAAHGTWGPQVRFNRDWFVKEV